MTVIPEEIANVETIAVGKRVRELPRLKAGTAAVDGAI
jgi:hypothetical protein